jgi:hypothetical protein
MILRRQLARQNDVAVEDGAHRVADGLVEIVAFHQHGEEAGDGAAAKFPARSKILGQQIENRRRVAFLAGRLAGRQPDFALRHGQARDRIHHQQDARPDRENIRPPPAPRNRRARAAAPAAPKWRRPPPSASPFRPQLVFEEAAHLAIALADHADHVTSAELWRDMEPSSVLFPHAAAAEDSDALAFAAGQQAVDGAHAGDQRLGDVLAIERIGGLAVEAVGARTSMGGPPSIGLPKPSMTRPSRPGETSDAGLLAARLHQVAQLQPSISSSGMESTRPLRKPITCVRMRRPLARPGPRRNRRSPR